MIHLIPHSITAGLKKENDIHNAGMDQCSTAHIHRQFPKLHDYIKEFLTNSEGAQFQEIVADLPHNARVLDIGVGAGQTSIYMASRDFQVHVAEPALGLCRYMEKVAELYQVPLEIFNTSAEFLHLLPVRDLDVCMFHASLHHCDDPQKALTNCYNLLRPGGRLFLLNEPTLQFFRSKASFQRQIQLGQLKGDYGGNEHIYYHSEYRSMLRRAGFNNVKNMLARRYAHPHNYLNFLKAENSSPMQIHLRTSYYRTVRGIVRTGWLGRPILELMKRLSLVQTNFLAIK